jgi:NIPSNAP
MMMRKGILAVTVTVTVILGLATAVATAGQEERVFELRTYYAPEGRLDDLQARFRDHTLKLFEKHGLTSIGYWVPIDNPENTLVYLLAFPSREAREEAWKSFFADPVWQDVKKQTEANGKIVKKVESVLLAATDFSPAVQPTATEGRVFELRTYTASPGNLENLLARFRDHTVKLFEKHGMTNVGYWCPLEGQPGAGETLIYMLAHKSVDAAKASFDAFRQDPAWLAARKDSEEKAGGALTVQGGVKSVFMNATDFSPLR